MQNSAQPRQAKSLIVLAWLSIAFFYFYQYILRVIPGVLVTDLRTTFHLTAEQFATLGSYYLYAYALCQIPIGILVDAIGIKKTVLFSILFCIIGTFLFACANSLELLKISRILIGIGSASAFMCALKAVVDYLPSGKRGFLMGATLTLGTLGAITAGKPLALLVDVAGWRETVFITGLLGLGILYLAYLFIPTAKPTHLSSNNHLSSSLWQAIKSILQSKSIMIYAFLAIGVYTPLSVLADLWGVSFIMQKYALTRADAAGITMLMYFGLGLGCLIIPWLSEKYHFLNRSIQFCTLGVVIIFSLILFGPHLSSLELSIALILLGVFCGVEMLCFTGASQFANPRYVGITLGIVNTLNMFGGGLLQQFIGFILDRVWNGKVDALGMRLYSSMNYTTALTSLLLIVVICLALTLFLPSDRNREGCLHD